MTSFWQENLAELKHYYPDLFKRVLSHNHEAVGEIIDTPAGIPTLRFFSPKGSGPLAYGTQDPWNDTAAHLQTVPPGSRGLALFIGLGLGYGPLIVLRERPMVGMAVVFEPDMDLFITALKHVDLRPLFSSRKVRWFVGDVDLAVFEHMVARIAALEDTYILRHVPSFQWHHEVYAPLNHQVFLIVNQLNACGGTTRKAGEQFFRNRMDNLSLLHHSSDLGALKNLFVGKPAVLVAAGPSLDRSLMDLTKAGGRCVLFAVDSALAPLLKNGIMPDFVTTIDYQYLNFEKLAPFSSGRWPFSLVGTNKVTPLILKRINARHLFLAFNDDIPQRWIHDILGVRELAPFAFSVAHLSLGVALIMGCDPIIFVGQDLGYTTANADHATGTIIMKDGLPTDREIFHIAGIDGRSVATDRGLLSLQKRFEDIIAAHPGKTYYNATMAGVHIEGTEPASLARLVEQYMSSSLPVGEFVEKAVRVQPPFPVTAFLKQSADILKAISKIEGRLNDVLTLSGNARREIARLRKNRSPIHGFDSLPASLAKKLSKFDRINKTLDAAGTINEHILELTYPVLSENDRWRERNEEVRERDGYLPWLLAEVERIEMVNKERHKAFVLYRNVLGNLTRHLVYEEECLARLAATRNEKEYLALVRLYAESGDYQLANGMIEQALALTPLCAEAHLLAGDVRAGLLDFSTANDAWRTALRLAPELAVKVSAVRRRHAEFWIRIADEHGNVGETGDNFPQLLPTWLGRVAEILADEEEIPDMLQQLWQKHAAQMEEWLAIGENGHVELVLRGWESFGGRFPELLVFRARYLAMQGDPVAAVAAMKRALVRKPAEPQWLAFLSRLLLEAGRFEEGIARLQEAVALDPTTAVLWEELGDTLADAGDAAGAAMAFERCYLALPQEVGLIKKIGDCYLAMGRTEAAETAYRLYLEKAQSISEKGSLGKREEKAAL